MTAHPHADPESGELLFFRYDLQPPYLTYYAADRAGQLVTEVPIDIPRSVMMHDFAITESRVVFVECPAVLGRGIEWMPEHPTRFGLLSRADPKAPVKWFEVPAFFVFHLMNAFDDGDRVVVNLVWRPSFGRRAGGGGPPRPPHLRRYVLDPTTGTVKDDALYEHISEFPRLDNRRVGRSYALGYAAARTAPPEAGQPAPFDSVLQLDVAKMEPRVRPLAPGFSAGEPVFVPLPGGRSERDGVILVMTIDAAQGKSEVLLLNPGDFLGEPRAVIELPRRVPLGLHGNWMADFVVT